MRHFGAADWPGTAKSDKKDHRISPDGELNFVSLCDVTEQGQAVPVKHFHRVQYVASGRDLLRELQAFDR